MVKNIKFLIVFFSFILNISCSFDNKTGIWDSTKKEKIRVAQIAEEQKNKLGTVKLYSSENLYNKEYIASSYAEEEFYEDAIIIYQDMIY